jgi:hypothetical protein
VEFCLLPFSLSILPHPLTLAQPLGVGPPVAAYFFQQYLAAVLTLFLYLLWKGITLFRGPMFIRARDMDLLTGIRVLDPLDDVKPRQSVWRRAVGAFV